LYQQFFNFNVKPFSIAPDPHFIFMSEHHQEGLAHLLYGINQGGGFVALTGEVGTGKTTLCHCLLQQLPENIEIALVLNPKLNAIELLATVCDELQIEYDKEKQSLKNLVDCLNLYLLEAHAKGKRTVLMIDEAQNLSLDVLEQIRLLTNLETSKTKLLQIILIGQPELKQLLEQPELRQLNQRITARFHLTPLSLSETERYIKHRLSVCGSHADIFNRAAIREVFKLSQGIPRLINILCDRALLGAYVFNSAIVTKKIIKQAAKEVFNKKKSSRILKYILPGGLTLIILTGFILKWQPDKLEAKPEKIQALIQQVVPPVSLKDKRLFTTVDFNTFIRQQSSSIDSSTSILVKLWKKELPEQVNCQKIESTGLKCLFDESDWDNLVSLNRPVMMEFTATDSEKFYAVLTGLRQGRAVFYEAPKLSFPIVQLLAYWEGYYLTLWQPPVATISSVYPGRDSEAVPWVREQFSFNENENDSLSNPDYFDDNLKARVIAFQQQHFLTTDGIVGPRTFIHLNNNDLQNASPKLTIE